MTCNLPIYIKRESQFVGIGTNQPGAALHVHGDIILAGQMFNAEGEPFSLGGGGGGSWKSRTSNLPLLVAPVAPGDGSGAAVIQVLSNVCLQKYGGNDNAYNVYTRALVVNAPSNREADYRISLPDMMKSNVYAPDTVIGEFWLTTTSNNESMTYKAVASVRAAEYDFATVRFLSGTTSVSFGHIGAGHVIELNGILAYATKISINSPPSDSIFIPAASVQWMEVAYPNPNVFGVGANDFEAGGIRKGQTKYVGDDIAYNINVTGTAAVPRSLAQNYFLALPFPVSLVAHSSNAIVGDFVLRVTNSGAGATYRAYARTVSHTESAVELRYINGTHDVSFYDIDVGSALELQGSLNYKTTAVASVAIPYDYIPNSLVQNSNGNIGIGTSLTPAKLTVGGDINFTGGLYQNGVTSIFTVNTEGNVGIGTGAPRDKLEVAGNILPSSNVAFDLGSSILRWRDLYLSGNTIDLGGTVLKRDEAGGGGIKVLSDSGQDVDTTVRNLNASGFVNIGGTRLERHVTGPLMVKTAAGDMESGMFKHVYVDGTANASNVAIVTLTGTEPALSVKHYGTQPIADLWDGNTLAMRVADGGNVGIGVANPLQKLHVNGNIFATGTVTASNLSVIGDFVTMNTVTSNTEQIVVTNAGTGPALKVTQTGANSIAEFYDDGGVLALKVADGGNVGIGTGTPLAKLDINGTLRLTSIVGNQETTNSVVRISNDTNANSVLNFGTGIAGTNGLQIVSPVGFTGNWSAGTSVGDSVIRASSGSLHINTGSGSTIGMVINNGNVGIGTTNPQDKLHVQGNVITSGNITNGGFEFILGNADQSTRGNSGGSRALVKLPSNVLAINYVGDFTGGTHVYGNMLLPSGCINLGDTSTADAYLQQQIGQITLIKSASTYSSPVSSGMNLPMIYIYNKDNTSSSANAFLSIRTGGASGGSPFISFDIAGVAGWTIGQEVGTNNMSIRYGWNDPKSGTGAYLAPNSQSWVGVSDERVKDIIETIDNGLDKVCTLRAVIGKFKTDDASKRKAFLIAQDVDAVLPEAVDKGDATKWGLAYTDVIPLLVSAIQDINKKLIELKDDVNSLKQDL